MRFAHVGLEYKTTVRSMFHYYKILLFAGMFVLAFGIVGWGNRFDQARKTALRLLLSVVAIWAYVLLSRLIVVEMDLLLASSQEARQAVYDGDGAKNAFALLFGWVPAILVSTVAWMMARAWFWFRTRQQDAI